MVQVDRVYPVRLAALFWQRKVQYSKASQNT